MMNPQRIGSSMRLFDCHSHWSTRRGYVFQTEEELINQERIWGTKATFQTEDEMVATFRKNNVRVDPGSRNDCSLPDESGPDPRSA